MMNAGKHVRNVFFACIDVSMFVTGCGPIHMLGPGMTYEQDAFKIHLPENMSADSKYTLMEWCR